MKIEVALANIFFLVICYLFWRERKKDAELKRRMLDLSERSERHLRHMAYPCEQEITDAQLLQATIDAGKKNS